MVRIQLGPHEEKGKTQMRAKTFKIELNEIEMDALRKLMLYFEGKSPREIEDIIGSRKKDIYERLVDKILETPMLKQ